jgi:DNA-binding GntR family transcriptional regulator
MIDHGSADPVWEQLAAILRDKISTGELAHGARLQSIKDLASEYGVSEGTVKHALARLRDESLIRTTNGKGSYVL